MMWAAIGLAAVITIATAVALWMAHIRADDPLPDDYQTPANKQIMDVVRILRRVGNRPAPGKHRRAA